MIYELRIYHCVTGRLPALLKRFETTTLGLWQRTASGKPDSGPCWWERAAIRICIIS
jgi:hypothetical protein